MNGRQKIEATFSLEGTHEIPAVICYEGNYTRDHWGSVTTFLWWYEQSRDIDQQMAWGGEVIPTIHQDWMILPTSPSRQYRKNHFIFIMSIGSPVTPGTTPERMRLYYDIAHEEGSR